MTLLDTSENTIQPGSPEHHIGMTMHSLHSVLAALYRLQAEHPDLFARERDDLMTACDGINDLCERSLAILKAAP